MYLLVVTTALTIFPLQKWHRELIQALSTFTHHTFAGDEIGSDYQDVEEDKDGGSVSSSAAVTAEEGSDGVEGTGVDGEEHLATAAGDESSSSLEDEDYQGGKSVGVWVWGVGCGGHVLRGLCVAARQTPARFHECGVYAGGSTCVGFGHDEEGFWKWYVWHIETVQSGLGGG